MKKMLSVAWSIVKKFFKKKRTKTALSVITRFLASFAVFVIIGFLHSLLTHSEDPIRIIKELPQLVVVIAASIYVAMFHLLVELTRAHRNHEVETTKMQQEILDNARELEGILRLRADLPAIARSISRKIVPAINQLLSPSVFKFSENGKGPSTEGQMSGHGNAVRALHRMLDGFYNQLQQAQVYGLVVETISPNPEQNRDLEIQYPSFVRECLQNSVHFLGMSLMPPRWWVTRERDADGTGYGLLNILETQEERMSMLRGRGDQPSFARIFILPRKLITSFHVLDTEKGLNVRREIARLYTEKPLSPDEIRQYLRASEKVQIDNVTGILKRKGFAEGVLDAGKANGVKTTIAKFLRGDSEIPINILRRFTTASDRSALDALEKAILEWDQDVKRLKGIYLGMETLKDTFLGIRLVSDTVYREGLDAVWIVDEDGYESIITSIGFREIIQQNEIDCPDTLGTKYLKRYKGFVEGRLFHYQDAYSSGEFGKFETEWRKHVTDITLTLTGDPKELTKYLDRRMKLK